MSQYTEEDAFEGARMTVFTGIMAEAEQFHQQWKTFVAANDREVVHSI